MGVCDRADLLHLRSWVSAEILETVDSGEVVCNSSKTESGRQHGMSWLLIGWIGSILIVVSTERSNSVVR